MTQQQIEKKIKKELFLLFRKEIKFSFLPLSAFLSFHTVWILHYKPRISGIYSNSLQLAKALRALNCTAAMKDFQPKNRLKNGVPLEV